ncbi:MAG: phospholipase D-like domain-containing protein, partial [Acidiferrobacteraceae bacterium]
IAHNKVMVIDGRDVITGSFNFSWSAQHMNAENVLEIVNSLTLARFYIQDWDWRRSLSTPAPSRP